MGKSILIIDTPKCCGECPMSGTSVCRKWNRKDAKTFPKDCQLKELPKKKSETSKYGSNVYYAEGYNACIDEILKEVPENSILYNGDNIGGRD